jgi:hypothetical protein
VPFLSSLSQVTNAVSVDYLTKPLEMMKEVQRVLKVCLSLLSTQSATHSLQPGGLALMSFSNRCFPTKAIAIWTSTGDLGAFRPPALLGSTDSQWVHSFTRPHLDRGELLPFRGRLHGAGGGGHLAQEGGRPDVRCVCAQGVPLSGSTGGWVQGIA